MRPPAQCPRVWLTLTLRDHTDFSESTEEIAPLTEEEKKAKLAELREKVKEKKASQADADKEAAKVNEVSPCKAGSLQQALISYGRKSV